MPPALLFFFKVALATWGLLWFHTNFRIVYSRSVKNAVGILIGIAFNVSVFVPVPYCPDDYNFVIEPEVQNCDATSFGFLFQHSFGYLGSFLVPYKF